MVFPIIYWQESQAILADRATKKVFDRVRNNRNEKEGEPRRNSCEYPVILIMAMIAHLLECNPNLFDCLAAPAENDHS
jgi:hypothetical protein